MPVQWKPKGNNTLYPLNLLKPAANSAFVSEKACPKCNLPFMYGYLYVYIVTFIVGALSQYDDEEASDSIQ